MANAGFLARLGANTKRGRAAGAKAMNLGMPVGMRDSMQGRIANRNAAYRRYGRETAAAGIIGGASIGLMYRGRGRNSQRGGYNPPRLREPRGSGRYA